MSKQGVLHCSPNLQGLDKHHRGFVRISSVVLILFDPTAHCAGGPCYRGAAATEFKLWNPVNPSSPYFREGQMGKGQGTDSNETQ